MDSPNQSILYVPIKNAGIEDALAQKAESHGYRTLAELLSIPITELVKKDWITPRRWEEIVRAVAQLPPVERAE